MIVDRSLVWWHMPVIPGVIGGGGKRIEFKATLGYLVTSKSALVT